MILPPNPRSKAASCGRCGSRHRSVSTSPLLTLKSGLYAASCAWTETRGTVLMWRLLGMCVSTFPPREASVTNIHTAHKTTLIRKRERFEADPPYNHS